MTESGPATVMAKAIGGLVLGFLMMPIFAVIPASLNHSSFISIPPQSLSVKWYGALLSDPGWLSSILTSFEVAMVAMLLSVIIGTLAALGLERLRPRARTALTALLLAPLIVPVIMISIALYYGLRRVGLNGTLLGMAMGHTVLCLPFVVLNVGVSMARLDPALPRAAAGLGATSWQIFRTVILPAIKPGLAAGAAFAFITSFDEVVISIFLAGVETKTLPVKLWEQIRVEFTPVAAAGSTVILAITMLAFAAVQAVRRRGPAA